MKGIINIEKDSGDKLNRAIKQMQEQENHPVFLVWHDDKTTGFGFWYDDLPCIRSLIASFIEGLKNHDHDQDIEYGTHSNTN